ncbi:hypothetical protein [Alkaliphilus serpentinus]|uniref:hypothetical protein n=1 Tax=Alkaliphilus serpentinus TaxID=1482731 RepID=UPI0018657BF1|nr:hypothetical protein [Alkaliphilus serpentinus]
MKGKIIDLEAYKMKKQSKTTYNVYKTNSNNEEERKETLDLFIKVLETMEKESKCKV